VTPIWTGRILKHGYLVLDRPKDYLRYVQSLGGHFVELQLRKRKEKRSVKANSFYWAVVVPMIAAASGMTNAETHDALKFELLRQPGPGRLVKVPSTSSLSVEEFSAYTERCQALGAQMFGITWEP
jgi:hypothetical protein